MWPHWSARASGRPRRRPVEVPPLLDRTANFADLPNAGPMIPAAPQTTDRPPARRPRLSGRNQPRSRPRRHAWEVRAQPKTRARPRVMRAGEVQEKGITGVVTIMPVMAEVRRDHDLGESRPPGHPDRELLAPILRPETPAAPMGAMTRVPGVGMCGTAKGQVGPLGRR